LDEELPLWVPIPALAEIQVALEQAVKDVTQCEGAELKRILRTGTVASTDNRNWELLPDNTPQRRFSQSRAVALDMESATIAANGFRFRVPYGTLLCVSDKPLHGEIKLPGMANHFYRERVDQHLRIGMRAIELLREVGIPRPELRVDAYPFQLSGGLRQRVGIAMALAGDPDILIADEPTTALDVTTQAQVLDLLRRLQAEKGIALMLITHDMGVIAEMCDDVAVMYLGRIVEYAPVETLFAAPRHPYTRALLRAVPTILAKPRQRLATIGGAVPHPGARPVGCPFHPRCSEVIEGRCTADVPPPIPPGQAGASCFLEVPG
jgi:oligopeptide/dipeptide ABC transporter ATP-binding protein